MSSKDYLPEIRYNIIILRGRNVLRPLHCITIMTHALYDAAVDAKLALLGGIYKKSREVIRLPCQVL